MADTDEDTNPPAQMHQFRQICRDEAHEIAAEILHSLRTHIDRMIEENYESSKISAYRYDDNG